MRITCTRSPSTQRSSHPRRSTTKSTTRNSSQSSTSSSIGADTVKAPYTKCRYSRTTRTFSTLPQSRFSTEDKLGGPRSSPASISKSTGDQPLRTANQMLYQGVRSIVLRKGGVRTNQSPRFCTKNILRQTPTKKPKKSAESVGPVWVLSISPRRYSSPQFQLGSGRRNLRL
jgi:hypothetical protein